LAVLYGNLETVKAALDNAFLPVEEGGLGIHRDEIWLTMKVVSLKFNIRPAEDFIRTLLASVGTDYFDLVLYHHPREFFDTRESLIVAWRTMTSLSTTIVRSFNCATCAILANCQKYMRYTKKQFLSKTGGKFQILWYLRGKCRSILVRN
jgi:hypothetical protein